MLPPWRGGAGQRGPTGRDGLATRWAGPRTPLFRNSTTGSADPPWKLITVVEQAGGVPVDTSNHGGTGTGFSGGVAKIVRASHVLQQDGYGEPLLHWTADWNALYPDFDPKTDVFELGMDSAAFPHRTEEAGLFFGLVDSNVVDANLRGIVHSVRNATGSTDQAASMTDTTVLNSTNLGLVDALISRVWWGWDGTDYEGIGGSIGWIEETTDQWERGVVRQGQVMRASTLVTPGWKLMFGGYHGSTQDPDGQAHMFRMYHRRFRGSASI